MTSSKPKSTMKNVPPPPGSKPSVYSRFIPREELSSFAAWSPGSLSGGEPQERRSVSRDTTRETPPEAAKANPADELAALVKAARQQGYQDGYRDGMAALDAFKQSFASQITGQVGALMQSLIGQMDALQQDMANALTVSATQLAYQVVRSELQTRPELIAQVAEEALGALLLSAHHITLRVHPEDHALVVQGAADALAARHGRVVSDATISRGGCVVESDIGVVEASIETRWRRAAALLGCEDRWTAAEPARTQAVAGFAPAPTSVSKPEPTQPAAPAAAPSP